MDELFTTHDTLLTARGQRFFSLSYAIFCNGLECCLHNDFLRRALNVNVVRNSKQARTKGRSNYESQGR